MNTTNEELHQQRLPSGMEVTLRRPTLRELAEHGEIPLTLTAVDDEEAQARRKLSMSLHKVAELKTLALGVAVVCIVEPPVAAAADDLHFGIDEMRAEDVFAVFAWANEPAKQLEKFLKSKRAVWELWNQAQGWSVRPSAILKIGDEWAAYQLDRAVLELGRWVEEGLRNKKTLEWLLMPMEKRERRFASLKSQKGARGKGASATPTSLRAAQVAERIRGQRG